MDKIFCNVHLFRVPRSWTGSAKMKSSMTFIRGNSCIERESKIEKAPRGIHGETSSKDMASQKNLVSTIGAQASPKKGDGTKCTEG